MRKPPSVESQGADVFCAVVSGTHPVGAAISRPQLRSGLERCVADGAEINLRLRRQIAAPTREENFGAVDRRANNVRPYKGIKKLPVWGAFFMVAAASFNP